MGGKAPGHCQPSTTGSEMGDIPVTCFAHYKEIGGKHFFSNLKPVRISHYLWLKGLVCVLTCVRCERKHMWRAGERTSVISQSLCLFSLSRTLSSILGRGWHSATHTPPLHTRHTQPWGHRPQSHLAFYLGAGGLNWGPNVCSEGAEPSPHPTKYS